MDVNPDLWKRRENGTVDLVEIPRKDWPPSQDARLVKKKFLYRWRPPYQLLQDLPDWYALCLACDLGKDGIRRFCPVGSVLAESRLTSPGLRYVATTGGLLHVASVGGHAILSDRGELEQSVPFTYHEARLFAQYARRLREYFGGTVKLGRVLHVCAAGRDTRDEKDILPEDLGLDSQGNGVRWGLRKLREEGLSGALEAGVDNPTPEQILQYGLIHAAMRNPLYAKQAETKSLVRMTLFDLGPTSRKVSKDELCYVAGQVKNSLKDHQGDTTEEFDSWLEDPKSNLIHRISKRKDCHLNRTKVRKTLLELGWGATEMLGRCACKQMEAFCSAFPDPLTEAERALFNPIYLGHAAYGDLPLLLLQERFDFLRESILRTWDCPTDERSIAIMHRMMFYYAELVGNRRASDRRYKRRSKVKNDTGRVAREEGILDEIATQDDVDRNETFRETARRLAVKRGSNCDFGNDKWDAKLDAWGAKLTDQNIERIRFYIFCAPRGFDETYFVPVAEFKAVAREVAKELARKKEEP